jgi:hypothetical protein
MKFDKIVGFGDSWMYGDELLDPVLAAQSSDANACWVQNTGYRESRCFLGLLGQHYSVPAENLGIPGGSLQSTIWNYLWWIQRESCPKKCLVLIFLTEPDRHSFYNPTPHKNDATPDWDHYLHTTWIEYGASTVPEEFRDLGKRFMVLTTCAEQSKLNYLQTALFFDGQAARIGMPLLQFHTTEPRSPMPIDTAPWPDHNWILFFRDHPDNQRRELIHPNGHPNEKGHEIIRDLLIPEIDRVILTE